MIYQPTAETLAIVQRLSGRWQGGYAMVRCPAHADRTPSLSIRQGERSILVHCFAGCDGANVMKAIARILGGPVPVASYLPVPANDRGAPVERIWGEAGPIEGTLAERYLAQVRGIRLRPPDVRFHPRCPKGKGHSLQFLPALLVGVFRRGNLVAIQRLFLDRDTGRRTARMMLGNSRGGTWPSRFAGSRMIIAEGFESACAYWQVTGRPAGTCFGARNFAGFDVPEGRGAITLLPDNDDEGSAQAAHAATVRRSQGIDVSVERCPAQAGDWADLLGSHSPVGSTACS
jgi:hypothetical protein